MSAPASTDVLSKELRNSSMKPSAIPKLLLGGVWSPLHVNGALGDVHGGFLDRFGAGRMRMAGARQIFRRSAELDQDRALVDHLAGFYADDVHAQHAIGFRVRQELDEAVGLLVRLGAAVGGERELADIV